MADAKKLSFHSLVAIYPIMPAEEYQHRGIQFFQEFTKNLKILGARRVTQIKFNVGDPQILGG
jgi:hypothetical protein